MSMDTTISVPVFQRQAQAQIDDVTNLTTTLVDIDLDIRSGLPWDNAYSTYGGSPSRVERWINQTGSTGFEDPEEFTSSSSGNAPRINAATLNGDPVITFDGGERVVADLTGYPFNPAQQDTFSMCFLVRPAGFDENRETLYALGDDANSYIRLFIGTGFDEGRPGVQMKSTTSSETTSIWSGTPLVAGQWYILTFIVTDANHIIRVNGVQEIFTESHPGSFATDTASIGLEFPSQAQGFDGDFARILWSTSFWTVGQRAQNELAVNFAQGDLVTLP